jgi:hypothetical protein
MNNNSKPKPYLCGREVQVYDWPDQDQHNWKVNCLCGIDTAEFPTLEKFLEYWNNRPAENELLEIIRKSEDIKLSLLDRIKELESEAACEAANGNLEPVYDLFKEME